MYRIAGNFGKQRNGSPLVFAKFKFAIRYYVYGSVKAIPTYSLPNSMIWFAVGFSEKPLAWFMLLYPLGAYELPEGGEGASNWVSDVLGVAH